MPRLPLVALPLALLAPAAPSQPAAPRTEPPAPKVEPVAETRLLMAGITKPNFDGLGRLLRDRPADAAGWGFARGQALLIGEAANLLMLRAPADRAARDAWLGRSADLRDAAVKLARAAAAKDHPAARAGVATLANSCNRCHETFRVPARVVPFEAAD